MLRLHDACGETVHLGQLQYDRIVCIEVVPRENALRPHSRRGSAVLTHASALGKAILAFSPAETVAGLIRGRTLAAIAPNAIPDSGELEAELRRVRERGYAFDRAESSTISGCVAAPILNAHGVVLGAMSISGPVSPFQPRRQGAVERLLGAAAEISRQFQREPATAGMAACNGAAG